MDGSAALVAGINIALRASQIQEILMPVLVPIVRF